MRVVDIVLAFPGFLLAIALAAILGPGLIDLVIALTAMGWTGYARLVRGEVLSLREREYVQAAQRARRARPSRVLLRHLLPAIAGPVAVQATFGVGGIIVAEAALSFLGLGALAAHAELGQHARRGPRVSARRAASDHRARASQSALRCWGSTCSATDSRSSRAAVPEPSNFVIGIDQMDVAELSERLRAFIREQGNFADVKIENLHQMPGGASREIWSFDCTMRKRRRAETRGMVLRRDPGAQQIETNRRHEFLVLRAAFEEGVPVPEVFWVSDDPAVLDAAFFIMQRVEGETIARRLLRDEQYANARKLMPAQLAQILARIHRIDPVKHKLNFLRRPGPSVALTEVQRYEQNFRTLALQPYPAFELTFRWLYQRVPKSPRKTLVHGDYRIGNVIFGPDGVRSILDWELAHLGDPMEDVGWMCTRAWRFGTDRMPVGGLGTARGFLGGVRKGQRRLGRSGSGALVGSLRQSPMGNHHDQPGAHSS